MSWKTRNSETKSRGKSKIRKRGCSSSSSSSSSSLVQKYRFKRAILVGKRGGSSTPVPSWKTSVKFPSLAMTTAEQQPNSGMASQGGGRGKEMAVSARKLAATLWEMNKIPSPKGNKEIEKHDLRNKERLLRGSQSGALPPPSSDPSYSPISEGMDRSRGNARRRRTSVISQKLQVADHDLGRTLDSLNSASVMEIEAYSRGKSHAGSIIGIKNRLKDVNDGLDASKELLKVLNRVRGLEEENSLSISLVSAVRAELDRARAQVDHLIKEQWFNHTEVECLMKHFAEEKAAWKRKERDRIRNAIACIAEELQVENKLRRQTERLNKKLGKELAETKALLSNAMKELESEKRAKEILEQVYDELARGIGEDRAEVEELKRESVKAREEVEKEREMLQLADVLREERVQMKLSEAKYHFEEKNAAVERLRNELEAYLRTKKGEENGEMSPNFKRIKGLEAYLKKIQFGSCENTEIKGYEGEVDDGNEDEEDDSADSDLHSIELNMDNSSWSYKWSYVYGNDTQDDAKRVSVDKGFKGRKSIEKIQWGSICLERGTSNDKDWSYKEHSDELDREKLAEIVSQTQTQELTDEIKRYRSIKSLRDHILSDSKVASFQNFASPTHQWGQSLPQQDPGIEVLGSQGDALNRKLVESSTTECRISTS